VELPVLAARINVFRQVVDERVIEPSPGKRTRKLFRIDARDERLDASVDHSPGQRPGRLVLDRKERLEAGPLEAA